MRRLAALLLVALTAGCGGDGTAPKRLGEGLPATTDCFPAIGPNPCATVSAISITCRHTSNAFIDSCSANVQMDIKREITSGTITVVVYARGDLEGTIVILPNTAPRAMTAQIPPQDELFWQGCTVNTIELVNIIDGPRDTGTIIYATSAGPVTYDCDG